MKALGSSIAAALGAAVQRPAILVSIAFSPIVRWTSNAQVTWSGATWETQDLDVRDLNVQAYELSGTLVIGNADGAAGALVIAQGATDRLITIWGYDAAAPGDFVWLCDAIGGGCEVGSAEVTLQLRHPCEGLVSPRTFVNTDDFGPCLPDGATVRINGKDMRIARAPY